MLGLLLILVGMALGPPTAAGANRNLIGNAHLNAPVGDFKVKTASNVRAHRLVAFDTTAKEIKTAPAGAAALPLGWVTMRVKDGAVLTDADYAVNDVVKVERGPGTIRQAVLLTGTTAVNPGDPLTTAGNGKLKKAVAISVTVPAGATAVTSTAAQPPLTVAGGVPPEPIVAYAMEVSDPAASDKTLAVMSAI